MSLTTFVADTQLAAGDLLETGDHPQRRRLAAAGRAHEDEEFAVGDVEAQVGDGLEPIRIDLVDAVEYDRSHDVPPLM